MNMKWIPAAFLLLLWGCAGPSAPTDTLLGVSIRVTGMVKAQGIT